MKEELLYYSRHIFYHVSVFINSVRSMLSTSSLDFLFDGFVFFDFLDVAKSDDDVSADNRLLLVLF